MGVCCRSGEQKEVEVLHRSGEWLKQGDRVREINFRDSAGYKDDQAVNICRGTFLLTPYTYCVNKLWRQGVPVTSLNKPNSDSEMLPVGWVNRVVWLKDTKSSALKG